MKHAPQTVSSAELKSFLNTKKRETRLIGAIERHILAKPFDERRRDVLHPSEIIKADWCHLASYHALRGNYIETRDKINLRLQSIFDEGHAIHAKWQGYICDMGVMYGTWGYNEHGYKLWALAKDLPHRLDYTEVPLESKIHGISGHADGWVKGLGEDFLIEIKSIGAGTMRLEAPALFSNNATTEQAWDKIRQPFRSHFLQGQVYLHLCHLMVEEGLLETAPKEIVFLYELKANQDYKEFVVAYDPSYIADIFDSALDIMWAAENTRPPACNINRENGCAKCAPYRGLEDEHK